jgi:hypothetical protein
MEVLHPQVTKVSALDITYTSLLVKVLGQITNEPTYGGYDYQPIVPPKLPGTESAV